MYVVPDEKRAKVVELYNEGVGVTEIASLMYLSRSAVYYCLDKVPKHVEKVRMTTSMINRMNKLYHEDGMGVRKVAETMGINVKTARRYIKDKRQK